MFKPPYYFLPNQEDFELWCTKTIKYSKVYIDECRRTGFTFPRTIETYEEALYLYRQKEVLLYSVNDKIKDFFNNILSKGKYDSSNNIEHSYYQELFENWIQICCCNEKNIIKTIDKIVLGIRLEEIRLQKELSRKKVAMLMNIDISTLKSYEYGYRMPNIDVVYKLSQIYGLTIDELIYV